MKKEDWPSVPCERCGRPITESQFADAVMVAVKVTNGFYGRDPVYRSDGPFHKKCGAEHDKEHNK